LKKGCIIVKVVKKKVNQYVRKETTLKVKTKKHTTLNISFHEMRLSWARIMRIFEFNKRRRKKMKIIESQIKNYKKRNKRSKKRKKKY